MIDTKKGRIELTAIPKAGQPPETAVFYDGIFKVTQKDGVTDLALVEPLAACGKAKASAGKKAKTRRLWGDGQGHVPHDRQVRRGDRPRHEVARPGLLRRHAHEGHPGRRERARQGQGQDDRRARPEELHG